MIAQSVRYESLKEVDWRHDTNSGDCYEQEIIEAAVTLSDQYKVAKKTSYFDLVEFSHKQYSIKRAFIDGNAVRKDLLSLHSGSVEELLKCQSTASSELPTEGTAKKVTTTGKSTKTTEYKTETDDYISENSEEDNISPVIIPNSSSSEGPIAEKALLDNLNNTSVAFVPCVLLVSLSAIASKA